MIHRVCKRCRRNLPINMFPSNPAYLDGKGVTCKACKHEEIARYKQLLESAFTP